MFLIPKFRYSNFLFLREKIHLQVQNKYSDTKRIILGI